MLRGFCCSVVGQLFLVKMYCDTVRFHNGSIPTSATQILAVKYISHKSLNMCV